jgi:hypothetical protein
VPARCNRRQGRMPVTEKALPIPARVLRQAERRGVLAQERRGGQDWVLTAPSIYDDPG